MSKTNFTSLASMGAVILRGGMLVVCLLQCPAWAQVEEPVEEPVEAAMEMANPLDELPHIRHLSAALAEPASRTDTLLTLVAAARLLEYGPAGDPGPHDSLVARFAAERRWLEDLAARFERLPYRSPVFDPASWYLGQELAQHGLAPDLDESPLGPGLNAGIGPLFERTTPALAASLLPELLPRFELKATILWQRLLDAAALNDDLRAVLAALDNEWFDPWLAAEAPAPVSEEETEAEVLGEMHSLRVIYRDLVNPGPPDQLRLRRLRFELLHALPQMEPAEARQAEYLLLMASAVDDLAEGRYAAFHEQLIWLTTDLLLRETSAAYSDPFRRSTAQILAEVLPAISRDWSTEFSRVDARINSGVAAAFEVATYLASGERDEIRLARLHGSLADIVAQVGLMIPDMAYYFDQPVRQPLSEEIYRCIGLVADIDETGRSRISQNQFDDCLKSFTSMAAGPASTQEIAGDTDGPFGTEQVLRELMLTPAQRINFMLGYMHDRNGGSCELPAKPLPNPLEWSALANSFAWFAGRSPAYFGAGENRDRLLAMYRQGLEILQSVSGMLDCISGIGGGINDPVIQGIDSYSAALDLLAQSLGEARLAFRQEQLRPGADVQLDGGAGQSTAFRPDDLVIRPCDTGRTCEMNGSLEATRALAGLFPDMHLLAHQSLLGEIEICYQNVEWVERRAEPVREDDPYVANFHGRLSFELVGRYREGDEITDVFASRLVSPGEYHYLFGPSTDEVLDDGCPTEWVGTRIVTGLNTEGRIRVVPDRLTYLAGARTRPSEVLAANWSRGDEWRDWFVTGIGVTRLPAQPSEGLEARLEEHLLSLHTIEQQEIYTDLLTPRRRSRFQADTLYELLENLDAQKALLRTQLNLFYPQELQTVTDLRASMAGTVALLDTNQVRRFRSDRLPVKNMQQAGVRRLEAFQSAWKRQPENLRRSGSASISMVQALLRLDQLYAEFFRPGVTLPSPPVELVPPMSPVPPVD